MVQKIATAPNLAVLQREASDASTTRVSRTAAGEILQASSAAATLPEREPRATLLETPVAAVGIADEVTSTRKCIAQRGFSSAHFALTGAHRKTLAEVEGMVDQQATAMDEKCGDASPYDGGKKKDYATDSYEVCGSGPASVLFLCLYSIFFFIAGFSVAELPQQMPGPVLRTLEQHCAHVFSGKFCGSAQGLQAISAIGVAVGCALGGSFADHYGRKTLLCLSDLCLLLGLLIPSAMANFPTFCVSRVLLGLGLGGGLVAVAVFVVECVPAALRGLSLGFVKLIELLGRFSAVSLTFMAPHCGAFCGCGVPALMVIFQSILLVTMAPESPRWLIFQKRSQKAIQAMLRLGKDEFHATEIVLQHEQTCGAAQASQPAAALTPRCCDWLPLSEGVLKRWYSRQQLRSSEAVRWYVALAAAGMLSYTCDLQIDVSPLSHWICVQRSQRRLFGVHRRKFRLALMCACVAACVGAGSFELFPALAKANPRLCEDEWLGLSYGVTQTLGVVLSIILIDSWGRGPITIWGTSGVAVGFSTASAAWFWNTSWPLKTTAVGTQPAGKACETIEDDPAVLLALLGMLFVQLMQNFSWSTVLPVIVTEVLPTSVRATGAGFAFALVTVLDMAANLVISRFASSKYVTAATFAVYALASYVALALLTVGFPEGKGRSLEDCAPEITVGTPSRFSPASCCSPMQSVEVQTDKEQAALPRQSPSPRPSVAATAVSTVDSEALALEMQTAAAEQQLQRDLAAIR